MVRSLTAQIFVEPELPLAPEYERVHFIGTALFNLGITKDALTAHADEMMTDLQGQVGYKVFLREIKVKHRILWTDVDFVMDIPYGYEESPAVTLAAAVALILKIMWGIAALAYIGWIFWTTWIEKVKIYYCEQHEPEPLAFDGYNQYLAHLAGVHPEKYEAASDDEWWEKLLGAMPLLILGLIGLAVIMKIPERRTSNVKS